MGFELLCFTLMYSALLNVPDVSVSKSGTVLCVLLGQLGLHLACSSLTFLHVVSGFFEILASDSVLE